MLTINSVKAPEPPTYTIKDMLGEPVQGKFYEQELQLSAQGIFRIKRVPRRRKIKYLSSGKVTVTFTSWVRLTDLEAWISISNMLGSHLKAVVKTILSFLGIYDDWLLERVNASISKNTRFLEKVSMLA